MANVPLKNNSGSAYLKAVQEAAEAVANWPNWKRETLVFTKSNEEDLQPKPQMRKPDSKTATNR